MGGLLFQKHFPTFIAGAQFLRAKITTKRLVVLGAFMSTVAQVIVTYKLMGRLGALELQAAAMKQRSSMETEELRWQRTTLMTVLDILSAHDETLENLKARKK
jgi:hypothetical protein